MFLGAYTHFNRIYWFRWTLRGIYCQAIHALCSHCAPCIATVCTHDMQQQQQKSDEEKKNSPTLSSYVYIMAIMIKLHKLIISLVRIYLPTSKPSKWYRVFVYVSKCVVSASLMTATDFIQFGICIHFVFTAQHYLYICVHFVQWQTRIKIRYMILGLNAEWNGMQMKSEHQINNSCVLSINFVWLINRSVLGDRIIHWMNV